MSSPLPDLPPKKYYCHTCKKEIQPIQNPDSELTCPHCQKDFVEEVDEEYPPVPPAPVQQQQPPTPAPLPPPPIFNAFPTVTINGQPLPPGQPSLLPIAQFMRFLTTQPNTNTNINANTTNNNRMHTFQHGPVHIQHFHTTNPNPNHTHNPANPFINPSQPLPPIFKYVSCILTV